MQAVRRSGGFLSVLDVSRPEWIAFMHLCLGGAQGGPGWRLSLRLSKRTLGDSRECSLSGPVNRANGALDALFSGRVLERVVCHYADEVMGWSSGECHWLTLPQWIAKSWLSVH